MIYFFVKNETINLACKKKYVLLWFHLIRKYNVLKKNNFSFTIRFFYLIMHPASGRSLFPANRSTHDTVA